MDSSLVPPNRNQSCEGSLSSVKDENADEENEDVFEDDGNPTAVVVPIAAKVVDEAPVFSASPLEETPFLRSRTCRFVAVAVLLAIVAGVVLGTTVRGDSLEQPFLTNAPTTLSPTQAPSATPSVIPTKSPTDFPSLLPSLSPTNNPSVSPSDGPTPSPTLTREVFTSQSQLKDYSYAVSEV